jgi:hypothetical protein
MAKEIRTWDRSALRRINPGRLASLAPGLIGQALARPALRTGRKIAIANSRGPETLAPVVAALGPGVSAGTVRDAVAAGIVATRRPHRGFDNICCVLKGSARPVTARAQAEPLSAQGSTKASFWH